MFNFLQYGYLGFLASIIYCCYKIIQNEKTDRTFKQTCVILALFVLIGLIAGGVGYIWTAKKLEASQIMERQIEALRKIHYEEMKPLQNALDDSGKTISNYTSGGDYRKKQLDEFNSINSAIKMREEVYNEQLKSLKSVFDK